MQLNPLAFNRFLSGVGQLFSWRISDACPCVNPYSGAANPSCPQCGGRGRIWGEAVEGMAGIAGMKIQRDWQQFGVYESGDVVLTIPSDSALYAMRQFDRVTTLNGSEPFSIVLTRGSNDTLRFPVVEIDRVFWLDGAGAIVEGEIPSVADDGSLTWVSGEPPAGKQYSIGGRQRPEHFCYGEFPQDRAHHGGKDLPRRVVLRRFDLFGR